MKQVVVISGGSKGLGKATASLLAKDYEVIILGRGEALLKQVGDKIGCSYYVCDITDPLQITDVVEKILEKHKKIDYLINNAGGYTHGSIDTIEPEEIKRIFALNVRGMIQLTKAVAPHMKKLKAGSVINVLSTAALKGGINTSLYHASKYAADGFTQSIAEEFKPFGIRVSAIYPGGFSDRGEGTNIETAEVAQGIAFIVGVGPNTVIPKLVLKHLDF
jgi:NAD(P)-dependent dehydrogenase (short-subunit alcohol dehydrogenase family)